MSETMHDFSHLSLAERIQLVEDLWDSIATEGSAAVALSDAQREELRRRAQVHDADPDGVVPWDHVRTELLQRHH
jgi:putative addiction module component (TIGR02574 family)